MTIWGLERSLAAEECETNYPGPLQEQRQGMESLGSMTALFSAMAGSSRLVVLGKHSPLGTQAVVAMDSIGVDARAQ